MHDLLCVLQYNLEAANNTFYVRFGDRVGWTVLVDYSVIMFNYAETHQTFFFNILPDESPPIVGEIVSFDIVPLPVTYSIAVLLDLSKFIVCLSFVVKK